MTNQSACRSARSGHPGSFTERSVSRQNRVSQGYPMPRSSYSAAERDTCECTNRSATPEVRRSSEQFPIGMTYTPMQSWENLYCPSQALLQGTLFIDLDKPFIGRRASR